MARPDRIAQVVVSRIALNSRISLEPVGVPVIGTKRRPPDDSSYVLTHTAYHGLTQTVPLWVEIQKANEAGTPYPRGSADNPLPAGITGSGTALSPLYMQSGKLGALLDDGVYVSPDSGKSWATDDIPLASSYYGHLSYMLFRKHGRVTVLNYNRPAVGPLPDYTGTLSNLVYRLSGPLSLTSANHILNYGTVWVRFTVAIESVEQQGNPGTYDCKLWSYATVQNTVAAAHSGETPAIKLSNTSPTKLTGTPYVNTADGHVLLPGYPKLLHSWTTTWEFPYPELKERLDGGTYYTDWSNLNKLELAFQAGSTYVDNPVYDNALGLLATIRSSPLADSSTGWVSHGGVYTNGLNAGAWPAGWIVDRTGQDKTSGGTAAVDYDPQEVYAIDVGAVKLGFIVDSTAQASVEDLVTAATATTSLVEQTVIFGADRTLNTGVLTPVRIAGSSLTASGSTSVVQPMCYLGNSKIVGLRRTVTNSGTIYFATRASGASQRTYAGGSTVVDSAVQSSNDGVSYPTTIATGVSASSWGGDYARELHVYIGAGQMLSFESGYTGSYPKRWATLAGGPATFPYLVLGVPTAGQPLVLGDLGTAEDQRLTTPGTIAETVSGTGLTSVTTLLDISSVTSVAVAKPVGSSWVYDGNGTINGKTLTFTQENGLPDGTTEVTITYMPDLPVDHYAEVATYASSLGLAILAHTPATIHNVFAMYPLGLSFTFQAASVKNDLNAVYFLQGGQPPTNTAKVVVVYSPAMLEPGVPAWTRVAGLKPAQGALVPQVWCPAYTKEPAYEGDTTAEFVIPSYLGYPQGIVSDEPTWFDPEPEG